MMPLSILRATRNCRYGYNSLSKLFAFQRWALHTEGEKIVYISNIGFIMGKWVFTGLLGRRVRL
jgi:hypothetical protein